MPITPEQQVALDEQNSVRAKYGVAPLQWDDQLAYDAYVWAHQLATQDQGLVHDQNANAGECIAQWNQNYQTGPYGTNYFALGSNRWWDKNRNSDWSVAGPGEEDIFHDNPGANYLEWGHFAIMKSAGFDRMGVWWDRAASGNIYIVARYLGSLDPPAFDMNNPTQRF